MQSVMAMPGQCQHALFVADMDKKKMRNVMRKTHIDRRETSFLKDCEDLITI